MTSKADNVKAHRTVTTQAVTVQAARAAAAGAIKLLLLFLFDRFSLSAVIIGDGGINVVCRHVPPPCPCMRGARQLGELEMIAETAVCTRKAAHTGQRRRLVG
eukprot:CAMPEP_0171649134 /NCGR_PEP_ID=MMETSP0990-20121206/36585_1 /TAXON_ID=483369 /ORGANISM="non described non described, Strain CCMP2098" /LENGTH=102 /DNA_ID=CAMNT_0012226919 /DNA_START=337 /DNA_END=646 /DNA_ORIENTATION=+